MFIYTGTLVQLMPFFFLNGGALMLLVGVRKLKGFWLDDLSFAQGHTNCQSSYSGEQRDLAYEHLRGLPLD